MFFEAHAIEDDSPTNSPTPSQEQPTAAQSEPTTARTKQSRGQSKRSRKDGDKKDSPRSEEKKRTPKSEEKKKRGLQSSREGIGTKEDSSEEQKVTALDQHYYVSLKTTSNCYSYKIPL